MVNPSARPRGRVVLGGLERLVFHVARQTVIEVEFIVVDLEASSVDMPLRKQAPGFSRVRVREGHHGLFHAA